MSKNHFSHLFDQIFSFGDTLSVFFHFARLRTHFFVHGGVFWVKSPQEAKISSKMAFSGGKNAFFDLKAKNVPQDASKCICELENCSKNL